MCEKVRWEVRVCVGVGGGGGGAGGRRCERR